MFDQYSSLTTTKLQTLLKMANSAYGYVRDFEQPDSLPLSNWIVVRIDGRGNAAVVDVRAP